VHAHHSIVGLDANVTFEKPVEARVKFALESESARERLVRVVRATLREDDASAWRELRQHSREQEVVREVVDREGLSVKGRVLEEWLMTSSS